jgi:hypothetical protein
VDTRRKILSSIDAGAVVPRLVAEQPGVKLVHGVFDPLLSWHISRLRQVAGDGGRVVVLLSRPENPILEARARAELVAALQMVAVVVLPPPGPRPGWLHGLEIVELDDAGLTQRLIERVRERHKDE